MNEQPLSLFNNAARSDWIRLRTLISLRWLAIFGQTAAILVATFVLKLDLRLDLGKQNGTSFLSNSISFLFMFADRGLQTIQNKFSSFACSNII